MNEFWEEYKAAHQFYPTRLLHAIGTAYGIYAVISGIISGSYWFCFAGIFVAYGLAWSSHWFIEGNSPLTLKNPIYSILCDFWMAFHILTGRNPK
ncbi:MAG TPA: DUF962 domain-containing protein [Nitrosomonas sp.]|nr:DUF962 domain-containing protein [Agitococcus sp.]HNA70015.1 DUF962 domain-containing protein [Nitrosomonas sp.]